ncbi:Nif3-like dinuclear metal center hexameric protein [Sedimentisphaera salicampi]|uniref:Nif3-like dinuclear metal center hexameric protein n=1 Tax=Sedimentisphaera salicampi TaxID=1941349 RepID=UPI000B9C305D|nr:Nif3-like dinuclear metal center hexameric protein [Sedimentisphaera salicampi]OXU14570.1 metal-binding protein [Sedimentisphaera salicampi]
MGVNAKQFLSLINQIYPLQLAQQWDNTGHLIGDEDGQVRKVLLCIDLTEAVYSEAERGGFDTILCYHPVIWEGLKKVTKQSQKPVIYKLIRNGFNVFSVHTACDAAQGGVNDKLAEAAGIEKPKILSDPIELDSDKLWKLTVFVPKDYAASAAEAAFKAGAGKIGNYEACSFRTEGKGTFRPLSGAKPAMGSVDSFEEVSEIRLEAVVPEDKRRKVLEAVLKAHPYEMPAYDFVSMETLKTKYGLGRYGKLKAPATVEEVAKRIKQAAGGEVFGLIGNTKRTVETAAVCAGSCGSIFSSAIKAGCQLYITGEMKHHEALMAQEEGLSCICLSHSVSERFILKSLAENLKSLNKDILAEVSKEDKDPFRWTML